MRITRRLALSTICGCVLGSAALTDLVRAQVDDAGLRPFEIASSSSSLDPSSRTPRLLGMGRLILASDPNNRIDLWDFARNPTGVLEADSATTLEVRPSTASASGVRRSIGTGRERQYLAGRAVRLGFEAWQRTDTTTAYGFYGDVGSQRIERPFADQVSVRARLQEPRVAGVLNGRMPFFQSERMRYAIEGIYSSQRTADEYRTLVSNGAGEYLGQKSDQVAPPEFFTPDEYRVSTLGGRLGLSYRVGPWLTASIVGGGTSSRIEGENSSLIHTSGTGEDRPYYVGKASLVGNVRGLEYGADGQTWTSSSEERWVFTLKAGINQEPFGGRGKKLDRDESGTEGRVRLRWRLGGLELNATGGARQREIEIGALLPPDSSNYNFADPADRQRYQEDLSRYQGSFNYFLNVAANRDGADSLALPDSVRGSRVEQRGWNVGYGAAWRTPGGRALLGVEYHLAVADQEHTIAGEGPRRRTWDIRSGLEYAFTRAFTGRAGYVFRSDDPDELKDRNKLTSHTLTVGLGLTPRTAVWGLDAGWAYEWLDPEDDPSDPSESRQQLAAQLRWVF